MQASKGPSQPVKLRIAYDELSAKYANQVIVNASTEEIYFDFSSGIVSDPASGDALLHIHTRIAMTPAAAQRFLTALQQTLTRTDSKSRPATATSGGATVTSVPAAALPSGHAAALPTLGAQ